VDSPAEVIAAFYAYESQIPRISGEKACGLLRHYGADARTCGYFALHTYADVRHSEFGVTNSCTLSLRTVLLPPLSSMLQNGPQAGSGRLSTAVRHIASAVAPWLSLEAQRSPYSTHGRSAIPDCLVGPCNSFACCSAHTPIQFSPYG